MPYAELTPRLACTVLGANGCHCEPAEVSVQRREDRWLVVVPRGLPRMERSAILVVRPDDTTRALLVRQLAAFGFTPRPASRGEEALELAATGAIPLVLLRLDLPGMTGLETLQALRALAQPPEVVVTARRASVEAAADAIRHGAFDVVPEPFDFEALREVLRAARQQASRLTGSAREADLDLPIPEIIGTSAPIRRVLALIRKAAPATVPVLIQGESGTGKELVARAIHALSPRASIPLTIVDCGALQETLLESELFGHERGAFTGAHALKHGLFETANHGTAFLDEIGEMSPAMQVKVLRALQSGEFRRVGSTQLIQADLRVIAATNRDLQEEVKRGRFREDLYYRLAVVEIHVPPLRERREDIPLLVAHFLRTSASGRPGFQLTPEAWARLTTYPWPGNIRELRNCVERLAVLADTPVVTVDALPPSILAAAGPVAEAPNAAADLPLEEVERRHILRTLERYQWNKRRAAAVLGIDAKTLYNKLRRYGVPVRGLEGPEA